MTSAIQLNIVTIAVCSFRWTLASSIATPRSFLFKSAYRLDAIKADKIRLGTKAGWRLLWTDGCASAIRATCHPTSTRLGVFSIESTKIGLAPQWLVTCATARPKLVDSYCWL